MNEEKISFRSIKMLQTNSNLHGMQWMHQPLLLTFSLKYLIWHSENKVELLRHQTQLSTPIRLYFWSLKLTWKNQGTIVLILSPASNPGSKPQRFNVKNCKSSTSDKLPTFKTFFSISCKLLSKNYIYLRKHLFFVSLGNFGKRNHITFRKIIWEKVYCINDCMVISNLVISLVPY